MESDRARGLRLAGRAQAARGREAGTRRRRHAVRGARGVGKRARLAPGAGRTVLIPILEAIGAQKYRIRGVNLAGRVTAVGKKVTRFKPGDEVLGGSDASFAEFTVTTEKRLAPKPAGITFEQAATLNIAGLTALLGCATGRGCAPGQRVLVNGPAAASERFMQIAKWLGAHVTAVTRAGSADLVRSLGADEVIDHHAEDFTIRRDRWNIIFDIGGTRPFSRCRRVLGAGGNPPRRSAGAGDGRAGQSTAPCRCCCGRSPGVGGWSRSSRGAIRRTRPARRADRAGNGHSVPSTVDLALSEAAEAVRYLGENRPG